MLWAAASTALALSAAWMADERRLAAAQSVSHAHYSGERISLHFQDIEVRTVLSIIAEVAGLNLVASDGVTGRVTLSLDAVPWDQVLDLVLDSHGLESRRQGSVILVAPVGELAERERRELAAREQREALAPLASAHVQVRYAQAEELAQLLRGERGGGLLTERGRVAVDPRTNTLLIQEASAHLERVMRTLERLDVPVKQVQIEARIVIAGETASRELGVNWGLSGPPGGRFDLFGASEGRPISGLGGLVVDLGGGGRGSGMTGFAFGYLSGDILLDLELRALESEGRSHTISQPRVITANRRMAVIKQGQERAYREAAASGAASVDFKEAVLSLEVTPQITPDQRIIMDLRITNDTFGEPEIPGGEPPIHKNEIATQVLVDDGETVVLGGILTTEQLHHLAKTPFLGDLPVLGHLFRYTQQRNEKVELLVFITPRILDDAWPLTDAGITQPDIDRSHGGR